MSDQAPEIFRVKFECSNGDFIIECHRAWAPIGVDHFYNLVQSGFYNDARFFRVIPGFVVQFGIAADPAVMDEWRDKNIKDEPVKESNVEATICYAKSSAPNSRTTQLFINLGNNARLDSMGFAAFGKVIEGMDVVEDITAEYGERPNQAEIQIRGNAYLNEKFPNLDYIKKAIVIEMVV